MQARLLVTVLLLACVTASQAQQLYRWTDEKGRVHITDSPPPSSAKDVQKAKVPASTGPAEQYPFELALAMQAFPVTLYTFPNCEQVCQQARDALNKRGIPFKEVQVHDEPTHEELKRVSGGSDAPTLVVGKSVHRGFVQAAYDTLLDAARYPKAGVLPARNQGKPKPPEATAAAKPDTAKAAEEPSPSGRYAPKAPRKPQAEPPKRYAPLPGKDEQKIGPYVPKPPAEAAQEK
jgi:glutaredoxin